MDLLNITSCWCFHSVWRTPLRVSCVCLRRSRSGLSSCSVAAVRSPQDWAVKHAGCAQKLVLSSPNHPSPPPSSLPLASYSHFLRVTARFISWHSDYHFPQPISSCCTPPSIPFTALFWQSFILNARRPPQEFCRSPLTHENTLKTEVNRWDGTPKFLLCPTFWTLLKCHYFPVK